MRPLTRWVLAFAPWAFFSLPAQGEPPAPAPSAGPSAPASHVAPERNDAATTASLVEEREFEAEARRYEKLAELTARLVREREQREFEAAAERYLRFAGLTQKLTEKANRELEQSFQAEVDLYLKKRELTRDLAERSVAVTTATSAPRW